jgi:hypothetical protein
LTEGSRPVLVWEREATISRLDAAARVARVSEGVLVQKLVSRSSLAAEAVGI